MGARVAILILAAGEGLRMGSIKQLLSVGNTNLLGAVIHNSLNSNANTVYCVLGACADKIGKSIQEFDVEVLVNDHWEEGLGSSIAAGVSYIQEKEPQIDAILIMLGDQPLVNPSYINQLISSFQNNSKYITASIYNGNFGVPAIFPRKWFVRLLRLKGDMGAKLLLNDKEQNIISISSEDQLKDIDTPDDYQQLLNNG